MKLKPQREPFPPLRSLGVVRAAAAADTALLLTAGPLPRAVAHAFLVRSEPPDLCLLPSGDSLPADTPVCREGTVLPQPPRAVRLTFSESVQPIGRGLRVIGPDGRRVDDGRVAVDGRVVHVGVDAEAAGTYRAVWSVISRDTHPDFGAMAFSVRRAGGIIASGAAPGAPAALGTGLGALAHLLHFTGYALGFGALTAARWTGAGVPDTVWRLTGAGTALLLLAEPAAFAAESAALGAFGGGADPAVVGAVLDSSFGRVLSQRLAAAILLWVLAGALRGGALRAWWTVPLLGLSLAVVDGEAAHATGVRPEWWGLAVNTVHLGAMGLWTGTTAFVLLSPDSWAARRPRLRRLAVPAALIAVATGIVMAAQHLTGLSDLAASGYGRTLAVKVGTVVLAGALGWLGVRGAGAPRARRWTVGEAAAMAAVLALAGLLVLLRPPVP
jgi:copper transport protein